VVLGFSWKSNNDVHPDAGIRMPCEDGLHAILVELALVAALHFAQDLIVSTLQWDVKVWDKALASGDKVDDLLVKQVGFNARDPNPVQSIDVV